MSAKQLEVQIMGQSYLLGCPEGGEPQLLAAVHKVDQAMCKIRDAGKIKARDKIAVLAALNLAFEHQDETTPAVAASPAIASLKPQDGAAGESSARLDQLLARLDQALSRDGQLI